jgi:hypothetical protein
MLYKFKSDAGADVIMLEASGKQVLDIIGKGPDAKGILLCAQMPAAKAALEAAIAQEESAGKPQDEPEDQSRQTIGLRTRAWPLLALIEHSFKADVPITWGV